jgi:hypothetical protein
MSAWRACHRGGQCVDTVFSLLRRESFHHQAPLSVFSHRDVGYCVPCSVASQSCRNRAQAAPPAQLHQHYHVGSGHAQSGNAPPAATWSRSWSSASAPLKEHEQDSEPSERYILKQLLVHVWPPDNLEFRGRVVGALGLLLGSKLLNIQVSSSTTADLCRAPQWSVPRSCDRVLHAFHRCHFYSSTPSMSWPHSRLTRAWQWLPARQCQSLSSPRMAVLVPAPW